MEQMHDKITNDDGYSVSRNDHNTMLGAVASCEYVEPDLSNPIDKMLMKLPIFDGWVNFKGKLCYAQVNFDATVKAKKPMMDIFYCATQCLNDAVLFTTQWDKNKFVVV
jgi:hypothetical protein